MKTTIKKSLQGLLLVPMLTLGVSAVVPVLQPIDAYAQDRTIRGGANAAGENTDQVDTDANGLIATIVSTLLFIIGAIAVIMLIYGGFRYVTSGGDSSAVTSAKNTILYAVIGIVVAVLAWTIVRFVLDELGVAAE